MRASVARLGCSPQAGSYRDKPPRPVAFSGLESRLPPVSTDPLAIWASHPVPLALGEMRHFSEIPETAVLGDLELVHQAPGPARGNWRAGNPDPTSCFAEHLSSPAGLSVEVVTPAAVSNLRRPRWELIRPAVVIRRRPQRN